MIELELTEHMQNWVAERGATAWRLEGSLREFKNFTPVNFWFEYPIYRLDDDEKLKKMPTQGSADAGRMKSKYHKTAECAEEEFRDAFKILNAEGNGVTVAELVNYTGQAERTIRDRVRKPKGEFKLEKSVVRYATESSEND